MSLSLIKVRQNLAETVNRVQYGGERIVLKRHGKKVAAIVSIEDYQFLEDHEMLEDQLDAKLLDRRLKAIAAGKAKLIPWEKVKAQMTAREKKKK